MTPVWTILRLALHGHWMGDVRKNGCYNIVVSAAMCVFPEHVKTIMTIVAFGGIKDFAVDLQTPPTGRWIISEIAGLTLWCIIAPVPVAAAPLWEERGLRVQRGKMRSGLFVRLEG
jgi:hypothetical protein